MAVITMRDLLDGTLLHGIRNGGVIVGEDVNALTFLPLADHGVSVVQHLFHAASVLAKLEQVEVRLCELSHCHRLNICDVLTYVIQLERG